MSEATIPDLLETLAEEGLRLRYLESEGRFSVKFRPGMDLPEIFRIGEMLQRLTPELTSRRRELVAVGVCEFVAGPEKGKRKKANDRPYWKRQTRSTVEHRSRIAD